MMAEKGDSINLVPYHSWTIHSISSILNLEMPGHNNVSKRNRLIISNSIKEANWWTRQKLLEANHVFHL